VSATLHYATATESLARLQAYLPVDARQAALERPLRSLHREILRALATGGDLPAVAPAQLERLRAADLVVVGADGAVTGAYPVTLESTGHAVAYNGYAVHAMCAVDALAIGPMFGHATSLRSRCHVCGTPIALEQDDEAIAPAHLLDTVHVGIAWRETCGCAAHSLCREMVFFCSPVHAAAWQADAPATHSVLRLVEAIRLAKAFFLPLVAEDSRV
jgi:mercuric reductase